MHTPLRSILSLGAVMIIAAACRGNTGPADGAADRVPRDVAVLGDTVHIALGGEHRFSNAPLSIRFVQRVSDSRCPANAICVRAGEAMVRLRVEIPGTAKEEVVKVDPDAPPLAIGEYLVSVQELHPYPGLYGEGDPQPRPHVVVRVAVK